MSEKVKTAKYLRSLEGWPDARVYELSEPYPGTDTNLVVVGTTDDMFSGPETYVFPATVESLEKNTVSDWGELEGTFRGGRDHARALAGFTVLGEPK